MVHSMPLPCGRPARATGTQSLLLDIVARGKKFVQYVPSSVSGFAGGVKEQSLDAKRGSRNRRIIKLKDCIKY